MTHSDPAKQCQLCDKSFTHSSLLRRHMICHQDLAKIFACQKCNRTFNKQHLLDGHVVWMHTARFNMFEFGALLKEMPEINQLLIVVCC